MVLPAWRRARSRRLQLRGQSCQRKDNQSNILELMFSPERVATRVVYSGSSRHVTGIFAELAREDYEGTVELVRGFEREAPRASATIAIARAILEEKKK